MAYDPMDLRQPVTAQQLPPGTQTQPTPLELQNMYQYAQMLSRSAQQPIRGTHPWIGGVANVVDALMGGYLRGQAANLGRQPEALALKNMQPGIPAPANMPSDKAIYGDAPSSNKTAPQGGALNFAPTGGSDDILDKAQAATSKQESGGKYDAVGVPTKYGRALGKYQIMPENVVKWSEEILGKKMTPEEFMANPAAQDAIYRGKMAQYLQKYGPEGAGRAWLGGEGSINKPDRRDPLGTSVGDYGKKFASMVGVPSNASDAIVSALRGPAASGGQALAFNGEPVQMAAAAPKTGGVAGSQTVNAAGPLSADSPPPPGILPGQSHMTPSNVNMILNNTHIDPAIKAFLLQQYMGTQVNPQTVPVAGGRWIVPADRSQQPYYIPDVQKGTTNLGGGVSFPRYDVLSPGGGAYKQVPNIQDVRPAPAPAPVPAPVKPQGALPLAPTDQTAETGAPFKTAALGPNVPVPAAQNAPPMGAGPLGVTAPPAAAAGAPAATPSPIPPTAPPEAAAKPVQVAQLVDNPAGIGRPPGLSDQDWNTFQTLQKQQVEQARNKKGAEENAGLYAKRLDSMNTSAAHTREQVVPHLQQALALLDDPNFRSGIGVNPLVNWQRVQAQMAQLFPNAGFDKYKASPNEVFTKSIADAIVTNMRNSLQGLGQVRVAEIELLKQAMASPHNTVESNRTLLSMALRIAERNQAFAEMAQDYASGAAVTNPFSPQHEVILPDNGQPRAGGNIDPNFDRLVTKLAKEYPPFTPEEIQNQKGVWERDKAVKPEEAKAATKGGGPVTIKSKEEYDKLQPGTQFIGPDGQPYTKPKGGK